MIFAMTKSAERNKTTYLRKKALVQMQIGFSQSYITMCGPWRNQLRRSPCDQKIMCSNPGIVSNSYISLGFGNPMEKQTFTNAAVHPAVMGSWEENVTLQGPCRQYRKLNYVRVGPFPVISGVIVKSWEKLQLESRLKTSTFTFNTSQICLKSMTLNDLVK